MCATPKVIGHSDVPLSLREFLECGEPNKAYLQIFNVWRWRDYFSHDRMRAKAVFLLNRK